MLTQVFAIILCALVASCSGGEGDSIPPISNVAVTLPIENELQQQPSWCWVATSRQIITSLPDGPGINTPPQCALAADALGTSPLLCCNNPSACDVPGGLQQQQYLIAKYGGRSSAIAQPTDPVTLYRTLQQRHAVILSIRGTGAVGHVVVLRGMFWQNGIPFVVINDPLSFFPGAFSFENLLAYWQAAIVVG